MFGQNDIYRIGHLLFNPIISVHLTLNGERKRERERGCSQDDQIFVSVVPLDRGCILTSVAP